MNKGKLVVLGLLFGIVCGNNLVFGLNSVEDFDDTGNDIEFRIDEYRNRNIKKYKNDGENSTRTKIENNLSLEKERLINLKINQILKKISENPQLLNEIIDKLEFHKQNILKKINNDFEISKIFYNYDLKIEKAKRTNKKIREIKLEIVKKINEVIYLINS